VCSWGGQNLADARHRSRHLLMNRGTLDFDREGMSGRAEQKLTRKTETRQLKLVEKAQALARTHSFFELSSRPSDFAFGQKAGNITRRRRVACDWSTDWPALQLSSRFGERPTPPRASGCAPHAWPFVISSTVYLTLNALSSQIIRVEWADAGHPQVGLGTAP
jgi:hypothetical protein